LKELDELAQAEAMLAGEEAQTEGDDAALTEVAAAADVEAAPEATEEATTTP